MRSSVFWLKRFSVYLCEAVEIVVLLAYRHAFNNAECCGSSCFRVGNVGARCS